MILSHRDIEEIAAAVMNDFNRFFYRNHFNNHNLRVPQARSTPIDQFATDYLNLKVSFIHLSSDGSFCGLTAYTDTEYILEENGVTRSIPIKRNEILLDSSFMEPMRIKELCGKRRFTLAHECAHQILFQLDNEDSKTACRKQYSARRCYSLRDLKTREDWNEWQANALGAAILMPQKEIDLAIRNKYLNGKKLMDYEGRMPYLDREHLISLCERFGVSKTAMKIRLFQLGYLEERPASEFYDPMEVLV